MNADTIWQATLDSLKPSVTRSFYLTFLAPLKALQFLDGKLTVQCPDTTTAQHLFDHAHQLVVRAVQQATDQQAEIVWVTVDGELPTRPAPEPTGALDGYPRWLYLLWKITEPHTDRDALLMEWAQGRSPTMLLETAQSLVIGWDGYRKRRKYQDVRRTFMAWYRVAQNGHHDRQGRATGPEQQKTGW